MEDEGEARFGIPFYVLQLHVHTEDTRRGRSRQENINKKVGSQVFFFFLKKKKSFEKDTQRDKEDKT